MEERNFDQGNMPERRQPCWQLHQAVFSYCLASANVRRFNRSFSANQNSHLKSDLAGAVNYFKALSVTAILNVHKNNVVSP